MSEIQCVVVTPERTELDVQADAVTLPLFDGEIGILKGHSPLVGRLGYGVLRIRTGSGDQSYFVEGGFVQVADNLVSVLTDRVVATSEINASIASEAMKSALEMPATPPDMAVVRNKALERARALTRVTSR